MSKVVSNQELARGWNRAQLFRRELLRVIGASDETVASADDRRTVAWRATGLTTFFTLDVPIEDQPLHAPFNVRTYLAAVTDLVQARSLVNELNTYTSLIRWLIVARDDTEISFDAGVDFEFYVVADFSTMLGNPVTEVPFRFAEMIVREQITRAWVLVSNGFTVGWAFPVYLDGLASALADLEASDENADYFDSFITPFADSDASDVLRAAETAFDREVQAQLSSGESGWIGFHGLTFEVPYGLGDFRGAVTTFSNEGDESNDTSTGLVRASVTAHPHFGNGIVCWLQVPVVGIDDAFSLD